MGLKTLSNLGISFVESYSYISKQSLPHSSSKAFTSMLSKPSLVNFGNRRSLGKIRSFNNENKDIKFLGKMKSFDEKKSRSNFRMSLNSILKKRSRFTDSKKSHKKIRFHNRNRKYKTRRRKRRSNIFRAKKRRNFEIKISLKEKWFLKNQLQSGKGYEAIGKLIDSVKDFFSYFREYSDVGFLYKKKRYKWNSKKNDNLEITKASDNINSWRLSEIDLFPSQKINLFEKQTLKFSNNLKQFQSSICQTRSVQNKRNFGLSFVQKLALIPDKTCQSQILESFWENNLRNMKSMSLLKPKDEMFLINFFTHFPLDGLGNSAPELDLKFKICLFSAFRFLKLPNGIFKEIKNLLKSNLFSLNHSLPDFFDERFKDILQNNSDMLKDLQSLKSICTKVLRILLVSLERLTRFDLALSTSSNNPNNFAVHQNPLNFSQNTLFVESESTPKMPCHDTTAPHKTLDIPISKMVESVDIKSLHFLATLSRFVSQFKVSHLSCYLKSHNFKNMKSLQDHLLLKPQRKEDLLKLSSRYFLNIISKHNIPIKMMKINSKTVRMFKQQIPDYQGFKRRHFTAYIQTNFQKNIELRCGQLARDFSDIRSFLNCLVSTKCKRPYFLLQILEALNVLDEC